MVAASKLIYLMARGLRPYGTFKKQKADAAEHLPGTSALMVREWTRSNLLLRKLLVLYSPCPIARSLL